MNPSADKLPVVVICGPTASGKTGLAVELAKHWPVEVVSADSRQVYRQMDIGTAKATVDEQRQVRHHMIDVVSPDQPYTLADYVPQARTSISEIHQRQRMPVIVGGTGLYIRGLLYGLAEVPEGDESLRQRLLLQESQQPGFLYEQLQRVDPVQAEKIHPNNQVRLVRALEVFELTGKPLSGVQAAHGFRESPYRLLILGINPGRDQLYDRINLRTHAMFDGGLVEETRQLLTRYPADGKALQTLGYREVQSYLRGEMTRDETIAQIQINTRRYAKRQMTWFNREAGVIWLESSVMSGNISKLIEDFMNIKGDCYGKDPV